MVRAPCCKKIGLKKGPWSSQEDHILISYIQRHGHGNWRALPKHAGLLRCGKSCRLRWVNYLRPDLKRGNFSREEEETIIKLHQLLGNRWSAIAARLPGRTDNEIKNVWHTHLKKKVNQSSHDHDNVLPETSQVSLVPSTSDKNDNNNIEDRPIFSPPQTQSSTIGEISLPAYNDSNWDNNNISDSNSDWPGNSIYEIDDNFWSEAFSTDQTYNDTSFNSSETVDVFSSVTSGHQGLDFPLLEANSYYDEQNNIIHDMDFWFNSLTKAGDVSELLY